MQSERDAIFLFDLIQDVSVLRPMLLTLAADTSLSLHCLVSHAFTKRDREGVWRLELDELCARTGASLHIYAEVDEAFVYLQGRHGLLFSASESNLTAHRLNHEVFAVAPAGLYRITVQHGHECVGFNQNREQSLAHGTAVRFNADIVCGWVPADRLPHLAPSERSKYVQLGPPQLLTRLHDRPRPNYGPKSGLMCENLHSVRMRTTGNFQASYLETLMEFARAQAQRGRKVALRPHPGGQYVLRNKVELPENVVLANKPMYKTDLARFSYGISAPSSVVIDMVLAGIPTAVWRDAGSIIDTSGYAGLTTVSTVDDWVAFADTAIADPAPIIARQQAFLTANGLDTPPEVIRDRLLALVAATAGGKRGATRPKRILLIANDIIPTLHISFLKPLEALAALGEVVIHTVTEKQMRAACGKEADNSAGIDWSVTAVEAAQPDLAVFCRYSGPGAHAMMDRLRTADVPVIMHIDDDLLNVPREIGARKFLIHSKVERTSTVRMLLDEADLVYCSTNRLRERLRDLGFKRELDCGTIYCSRDVITPATLRPARTIGFMGNDKTPELTVLAPVIAKILDIYPDVNFELFGSMAMPDELKPFDNRVRAIPPTSCYDDFVTQFSALQWDIGLCPLISAPFNIVKADTKWVDYSSIGAAVIASAGTAYDSCCADGCGILVHTDDEWLAALTRLIDNPAERHMQVMRAQSRLLERYSLDTLRNQVLDMFDRATARHIARAEAAAAI